MQCELDENDFRICTRPKRLLHFLSASLLKQQSTGNDVAPLRHIMLISSQPVFDVTPKWLGLD
jgi:hypothetical protein